MRILFVGTVEFSRHCLEEVLRNGGEVATIMTLARERASFNSDYADLSDVAEQRGIAVHKIKKINDPQSVELIRALNPDVIFVFGWSQLISKEILDVPRLGCIGSHPALLPRDRGRHPIVWALVEGLEKSGLTFFYLDEGADSGDILWQRPFPITIEDDARSVYEKIKALASEAIREFLPQLESGSAPRVPQDHRQATYWRKRGQADGEIDWTAPTAQAYNLVRALTRPYVGAHTFVDGRIAKIWKAALPQGSLPIVARDLKPGDVFESGREPLYVRTGDGHMAIVEHEVMGGGAISVGAKLGSAA